MKKMKIGYLIRVRPDLEDIIPDDVDGVRIQVGDDGLYSDEDLAKVADADAFVIQREGPRLEALRVVQIIKPRCRMTHGVVRLSIP